MSIGDVLIVVALSGSAIGILAVVVLTRRPMNYRAGASGFPPLPGKFPPPPKVP